MELKEWYLKVLRQYTDFSGRARRREYWMFVLANFIIAFVLGIIDTIIGWGQILSGIYSVALLLPSLAVAVRRLHDIGKSGWWLFLCLLLEESGLLYFCARTASMRQTSGAQTLRYQIADIYLKRQKLTAKAAA